MCSYSSQQPSYILPFLHLPSYGYKQCRLSTAAIVGIAVGGCNNTPPVLIDALVLTPGLCLLQLSSLCPSCRDTYCVGLSQAPGSCPDNHRIPPTGSTGCLPPTGPTRHLLSAGSTGYWHCLWEPIWSGPTAAHSPVPAPGAKRIKFPIWVRPQLGLCSGAISTTVISSLPLSPILLTLIVVGYWFTTSARRKPSLAIVART